MMIKASGHAALVLTAGFWICAAGPSQAADDADSTAAPIAKTAPVVQHSPHHWKKYAHHKSSKAAEKSSDSRKTADATASSNSPAFQPSQLPPSVANAHAQLATDTSPTGNDAKAMAERANNLAQATPGNTLTGTQPAPDSPVVASDQLNDVDRALAAPPARPEAAAAADAQQAPPANRPAVVIAASNGNSTWDQTSLIGKIFIGFGTLLTVASAARMFIA